MQQCHAYQKLEDSLFQNYVKHPKIGKFFIGEAGERMQKILKTAINNRMNDIAANPLQRLVEFAKLS